MEISVVSPVYKSRDSILELVDSLSKILRSRSYKFEIILIDDGCPDDSWEMIQEACKKNDSVRGIRFSRNFGQHKAITAGLNFSKGEKVIVMDCDLQDGPEYLLDLIDKSADGFDIVYTRKERREHSLFKNITSKVFRTIFNYLVNDNSKNYDVGVGTFSLLTRKVVNEFLRVEDTHRHYLMILRWLGFRSHVITIKHKVRKYGKSSYNISKLIEHAIDGITSQSNTLLYLSIKIGFIFLLLSLLGIVFIVVLYFSVGFKEGWASIIVMFLLCTSVTLMSLGMNGIYIGKNFDQSKKRPLYIVDEIVN